MINTPSKQDALNLLASDDLIELGIRAHAKRLNLYSAEVVTYCIRAENSDSRVLFDPEAPDLDQLDELRKAESITPMCVQGATAMEYLKLLAVCRLYLDGPHIQLDAEWSGLKVAQLALRFGADDFGRVRSADEDEIRRIIRDAGFIPKERDPLYRWLSIS